MSSEEIEMSPTADRHTTDPKPKQSTKDVSTCCDNIKAMWDKYCVPNNAAILWAVWLIVQLIASVLLLTLTGLQFALVKPDLCDSYKPISTNSTNATDSPSCEFSGATLALLIFACIVSIVDATANMPFLIKEVNGERGGNKPEFCCKHFNVSKMNTIRVWYCWILVHAILITIAANTYEWSWGTGNLRELANTVMFFLTSVVYLLMIAAMIVCYSCRRVSEQSAPRSDLEQTVTRITVTNVEQNTALTANAEPNATSAANDGQKSATTILSKTQQRLKKHQK